jgi:hypothetical protein
MTFCGIKELLFFYPSLTPTSNQSRHGDPHGRTAGEGRDTFCLNMVYNIEELQEKEREELPTKLYQNYTEEQ